MNPFDRAELAARYEAWYSGRGRRADRDEKAILARLLGRLPPVASVLEAGCGTGHFARWLQRHATRVVGLDLSRAMLAEASRCNGLPYVRGDALALPFADAAFDAVAILTTLEFVADPARAVREAVRVARKALIVGALNRRSWSAFRRRRRGTPPWDTARFFTAREVVRVVAEGAGPRATSLYRSRCRGAFLAVAVALREHEDRGG